MNKMNKMDRKMNKMGSKLNKLDRKMNKMDCKMNKMNSKMNSNLLLPYSTILSRQCYKLFNCGYHDQCLTIC